MSLYHEGTRKLQDHLAAPSVRKTSSHMAYQVPAMPADVSPVERVRHLAQRLATEKPGGLALLGIIPILLILLFGGGE